VVAAQASPTALIADAGLSTVDAVRPCWPCAVTNLSPISAVYQPWRGDHRANGPFARVDHVFSELCGGARSFRKKKSCTGEVERIEDMGIRIIEADAATTTDPLATRRPTRDPVDPATRRIGGRATRRPTRDPATRRTSDLAARRPDGPAARWIGDRWTGDRVGPVVLKRVR